MATKEEIDKAIEELDRSIAALQALLDTLKKKREEGK